MKVEVYTAITGNKDEQRTDIKCFTDYDKFKESVRNAKIYKVLAHQYISADFSIWVDGNIKLLAKREKIVKEWLGDEYDIAVWKHIGRNCIYQEAGVCMTLFPDQEFLIRDQMDSYFDAGYPESNGLGECNVIVRRHCKAVEEFNNAWWSEICRWSFRDQLSFPYVAKKLGVRVNYVQGHAALSKDFEFKPHKIKGYENQSR